MAFGSDYIGPPAPRVVTREQFTVPRGRVLCSCGYVIRLRVNGLITKHGAPCPMSGRPAKSGDKL